MTTMDTPNEEIQRKIEALKRAFVATLEKRLTDLEAGMAQLRTSAPLAEQKDGVRGVLEQAHKIAGSAGTFGYRKMSVIASETELLCDSILKGTHGADAPALADLTAKIAAIRAEAAG
jgi:HPt (histidine-containing phosphotransfer) domain-containing protein